MKKRPRRTKSKVTRTSSPRARVRPAAPCDFIRVVPLHHPKPSRTIEEVARLREAVERDPYAAQPHLAPASAKLTYRGGPLLRNVEVFTTFWGKTWGSIPTSAGLIGKLNRFFEDILVSPAIDQLAEYSVPGQAIGHGSLIGTATVGAAAPSGSVTDSTVQSQVKAWIASKIVPKPTANSLYFIYLEPGVVSILGGSRSCLNYCGYHNNVGKVYYALMPYPACDGCLGPLSAFDALTGTSSHELCEAITDPVPGSGWYDDVNGEIGDICAWNFKQVAGYTVQMEWSNRLNRCA